ncbi:MAG: sugar transferase [Candidatus Absconditabacteria bacterium]
MIFRLLRPVFHAIGIVLIFMMTYNIRLITDLIPGVQLKIPIINYRETLMYAMLAAIVFVGLGLIKHLYELNKPVQKYFQTFTKVWLYWLVSITFVAYFGQGFIFFFGISRFIIIIGAFFAFFLLFFFDQFWNFCEAKIVKTNKNKIMIIGSDTLQSYKAIEEVKNGFPSRTEFLRVNELDGIDLGQYESVVVVGNFEKELLQNIFEKIRFSYTRFYHISEGFFMEDVVYTPEAINNIIALEYKNSTLDGRSSIWKRVFDIVSSLVGIIVFSPVFLIVAIWVKLDSKGPAIFIQKRVGRNGQLFTFLKFRSMYTHMSTGYGGKDADELYQKLIDSKDNVRDGVLPKIKNDPRVTKIGRFLRKTSLDELPQLFCVLVGTMSLVGPRPHLPNEVEKYEVWEKRLLSIKPGITGYAQVFGRDSLGFEQEAKLDLYYIQNRTVFMDVYIVFATLGVVFKGR